MYKYSLLHLSWISTLKPLLGLKTYSPILCHTVYIFNLCEKLTNKNKVHSLLLRFSIKKILQNDMCIEYFFTEMACQIGLCTAKLNHCDAVINQSQFHNSLISFN